MGSSKKQSSQGKGTSQSKSGNFHRQGSRVPAPSKTTLTATVFALATLGTMAAAAFLACLLCPMSVGIRLFPEWEIAEYLQILPLRPVQSDTTTAIGSAILLCVMSALTRNATLEVDRVGSGFLRKAWMAFFELLWFALFVVIGEMLASCMDGLLATPWNGTASWGFLVAVVSARCIVARHEHHGRHVACEALRSVGRSSVACLAWATISLIALPYGIQSDVRLLFGLAAVVVLVALVVIGPCLLEGRHGDEHGHGHKH